MTERELARIATHRLAVLRHAEEVTKNVSQTCRNYGITRQSFYKWRRRYTELGEAGLRDRPRGRTAARGRPARTSSARSSTCARTTTSAR